MKFRNPFVREIQLAEIQQVSSAIAIDTKYEVYPNSEFGAVSIPRVLEVKEIDPVSGCLYYVKVDAELNAQCPLSCKEGWIHPSQYAVLAPYKEVVNV